MSAPTAPAAVEPGEITVHRCTVTVVRSGGWSWGPDPRGLVRQVVDALPELLADHFAERLAGDGPDVEITEPLTVTVRQGRPVGGVPPVEVHFAPVPMVELPADAPGGGADAVSLEESFAAAPDPWTVPSAAALFAELAERGELDALLALLPDESVRAYLPALLGDDDATAARLLAELVGRALVAAAPPAGPHGEAAARPWPVEALPPRLRAAVEGAEAADLPRLLAGFLASADREEAVRVARSLAGPYDRAADEPQGEAGGGEARTTAGAGTTAAAHATGEVRVWSALPFLLAGPLARIGYLDAIGPALAGIELVEQAPLFAAALGYKALGVTARGWRRADRDSEAAAAFAGLTPPVAEERLADFARQVRPALPVLDGVLALSVCRGHDPADPLLITGTGQVDGELLLVDAHGMFPIAWAARATGLLPYWQACGRPPVLLCDGPLPSGTLPELAAAGVPFLTGVRPLRGDPVARLPWRTPLWTAAGTAPDPRLAAELPAHAQRFAHLVTALVTERRAVPLARDGGLERTVTLAAALGLATIAWTLWRDRETPDPLLALSRFADLEATVRYESAAVRVRVPMGRRHADLLRGGLLADVPDVVWLGGRTLTFSAG